MAGKKPAKQKKVKANLNKPAPRPVVHLDYLRVYHEVLKHEEVLDYDLDLIFDATIKVLQDNLADKKLSQQPDGYNVEVLVSLVMEELVDNTVSLEDVAMELERELGLPGTAQEALKAITGDFDSAFPGKGSLTETLKKSRGKLHDFPEHQAFNVAV